MGLDAILIADTGTDTFSGSSPLRLQVEGRVALIQVLRNYVENRGRIVLSIEGDNRMSWASAPRLNGICLWNFLRRQGLTAELIGSYYQERDAFAGLMDRRPSAIIVSTTFIMTKSALRELISDIRAMAPETPIIVGGPFVYSSYVLRGKSHDPSYDTASAKDHYLFLQVDEEPLVDLYIVSQRGESTLCEAVRRIVKGDPVHDLPNTATLSEREYSFTKRIDDTPSSSLCAVDWSGLPDSLFASGVMPIQASNGCPFRCAFCNFIKNRRLLSVKPLDHLIEELKALSRRGARYIRFVDDNFRLGKPDLNTVCRRFIDEGLSLRWMSFVRASALKDVDFDLLRQSGCIELELGLESADPQVLRNMNKEADPKLYADVVQNLLAADISCLCCFIIGFPGETRETVDRTVQFIQDCGRTGAEGTFMWNLFPFLLAPLSHIYDTPMRHRYGLEGYMHSWRHRTMDSLRAGRHIEKAFLQIEGSSPAYRGDNLDMLLALPPRRRKEFVATRHEFSKRAARGVLDNEEMIRAFSRILLDSN